MKGKIEEIISKAIYSDDPNLYIVKYRDFEKIKEIPLPKFMELSINFQIIPASRIIEITKQNVILYKKSTAKKKIHE